MANHSRRDFARLLALSGSAALFPRSAFGRGAGLVDVGLTDAPLPQTPAVPDEAFWRQVRARFLVPPDLHFFNAANLCPTSLPALEAMERHARRYETGPAPDVRTGLMDEREAARSLLAAALRVTPEEVVITRNTTEGNNLVSSGLDLGDGGEVVVWDDNHPSNLRAWELKAARFGFSLVRVPVPDRHPGTGGYVDLFSRAFTPRTRVVAITHVSSNSGDLLPAGEICAAARARGILSLVDGAQSFGVLDVDLSAIRPDFYTGSMHKWPCGPKEKGVLYVNAAVHDRVRPSIVGLYAGRVGISRTLEAHGQRDDASIAAVKEALEFQGSIGRDVIERRARQLAAALMDGLRALPGVTLWTDPAPERSAAIVIFRPGTLDVRRLGAALRGNERVVCTTRGGAHNPGLRVSPHFFNTMDEIDGVVGAIRKYLAAGV
jgi:selenocysteine lyase/cysteine desulfurase